MGSSGNNLPKGVPPEEIKDKIEQAQKKTKNKGTESKVNTLIDNLLSNINTRDTDAINKHIETIVKAIEKEIEESIDVRFGGSVQKHTYVDGLSDIDSLVLLNGTELEGMKPKDVLTYFKDKLIESLPDTKIEIGTLAVTIEFSDGIKIQLLPAVRAGSSFKIPSSTGKEWSKINPSNFINKLREVNENNNKRVMPTIKMVKAIISKLPKHSQLTGYHVESLAIEIFKNYSGEKTIKSMIQYYFNKAKEFVKTPITDKSGQSIHVDDYLGAPNSKERDIVGRALDRILRKMNAADASNSVPVWKEIID